MKVLKCLAISNSYPPDHAGGYELGARNLLNALRDHAGWRSTVVASVRHEKPGEVSPPQLTGFFPGPLGPDFERWKTKLSLLRNHSKITSGLADLAKRADLIFVFNPRRLIYPQWTSVLASGKPAFVFVSDYWPQDALASDIFYAKSAKLKATTHLINPKLRAIYSQAPHVNGLFSRFRGALFASRFLERENKAAFSEVAHQQVIHWGIDTKQFPPVEFSLRRLKVFGFCGRPEKEKGLDLALDAFRSVAKSEPAARMLIASDLSATAFGRLLRREVRKDAVLNSRVTLLGHMPHSLLHRKFYSQIGVLLFPSIWNEPFALTVLEAMASGALVIGSSTGGTPEIVDASTGYLFNPNNSGELAARCLEVLEIGDDNYKLAQGGMSRIREHHTLSVMARDVNTFVRGLL